MSASSEQEDEEDYFRDEGDAPAVVANIHSANTKPKKAQSMVAKVVTATKVTSKKGNKVAEKTQVVVEESSGGKKRKLAATVAPAVAPAAETATPSKRKASKK